MNLEKVKVKINKQLELKSSENMLHEDNLTHKDLAAAIEMCPTILSKKLKGRGNKVFTLYDILDILKYFDCKFEDIFGGNDEKT